MAIDNKIEQAMDLVKSHLMFAVREEVEVLKERIDVLMERIAVLETENQFLRAAASQVSRQVHSIHCAIELKRLFVNRIPSPSLPSSTTRRRPVRRAAARRPIRMLDR